MLNPFRLLGRILIAGCKICGYSISFGAQSLWYLIYRRPDRIGASIGSLGSATTDAIAEIFRR